MNTIDVPDHVLANVMRALIKKGLIIDGGILDFGRQHVVYVKEGTVYIDELDLV